MQTSGRDLRADAAFEVLVEPVHGRGFWPRLLLAVEMFVSTLLGAPLVEVRAVIIRERDGGTLGRTPVVSGQEPAYLEVVRRDLVGLAPDTFRARWQDPGEWYRNVYGISDPRALGR